MAVLAATVEQLAWPVPVGRVWLPMARMAPTATVATVALVDPVVLAPMV
jgi:hypothetical protein